MKRFAVTAAFLIGCLALGLSLAVGQDRVRRFASPTAILSADPATINKGEAATLTWTTANATSATLGTEKQYYTWKDPLQAPLNGSMLVTPASTTTYYLLARNRRFDANFNGRADGRRRSSFASVTVTVVPQNAEK